MKTFQVFSIYAILSFCLFIIGCNKNDDNKGANKLDNIPVLPYQFELLKDIIVPEVIDEYIHPLYPGGPGWDTVNLKRASLVVQMPDTILKKISTWGLVKSCFHYPLYVAFTIMDDQAGYINSVASHFNGFMELLSRKDLNNILLYNYRFLDFNEFSNNSVKLGFIDLLMGCDSIVSKLNNKQKVFLVATALEVYKLKHGSESGMGDYPAFIMANTMVHAGYKPFIDFCAIEKDYFMIGPLKNFNCKIADVIRYAKQFMSF